MESANRTAPGGCKSSRLRNSRAFLLERLRAPEEAQEFEKFEELSKLYAIEAPFTSRTQIELMFDVYDGCKLQQGNLLEEEEDENEAEAAYLEGKARMGGSFVGDEEQARPRLATDSQASRAGSKLSRSIGANTGTSWCKLLSAHNNRFASCLRASETLQDFSISNASSSDFLSGNQDQCDSSCFSFLTPNSRDDSDEAELKLEVKQMIGPLMNQLRRSSTLSENSRLDQSVHSGLNQPQQQVILDGSLDSGHISVCLLDKRRRLIKNASQNGRFWAQFELHLDELELKLAHLRATNSSASSRMQICEKMDNLVKIKRKSLNKRLYCDSNKSKEGAKRSERVAKEQVDQLIELTKNSLNHLIDAQLLLRNKLNSEQQQQQTSGQQFRGNEYETLLKNNFNLLKIWQNLEETKQFACFVCEPIRATLSDLFWFSGREKFFGNELFCHQIQNNHHQQAMLISPLVNLDPIQVRVGLLQILEALHYLHAICKLIHRNLNPKNILIASNDNWKLSGLEFAIRFESATISESASVMAHEGAGLLLRYSSGASAQSNLRRQRTLHQTKCEEIVKRQKNGGGIQPDLNYMAPELFFSSKCSHKSDIFSYGLIVAQTYDLGRHKPAISCKLEESVNNHSYQDELKKLEEKRKRKLMRLVPFEMRIILLDMLEFEPNFRPSANYALQLFRRPIELCKANEDSLRHLRSSLSYLDTRCAGFNLQPNGLQANLMASGANNAQRKRINYFKKVTQAAEREPQRKQTRNLHLLNLLCRGVDSLANNNAIGNNRDEAGQQQFAFPLLKSQFEQTFECLRQLYKSANSTSAQTFACPDSRLLMLSIVLHRRLLDQVAQMRAELPPVSRLTAANWQSDRVAQNQRSLAELEDRLLCLVSRQSMTKLAPLLTDPLLKLDEFLLVYELVNDLLAFVGQKCRQNYIQRGKQLLNELTPVTGCPSLSSSDEEDCNNSSSNNFGACIANASTKNALNGSSNLKAVIGSAGSIRANELTNVGPTTATTTTNSNSNRMNKQRFSDYEEELNNRAQTATTTTTSMANKQQQQSQGRANQSPGSRIKANLPTKISITAPSPMGSMREVNRTSNDFTNAQQSYSSYRTTAANQFYEQEEQQIMIEQKTSQLSLDNFEHQQDLYDNYDDDAACVSETSEERNGDCFVNANDEDEQSSRRAIESRFNDKTNPDNNETDGKSRSQLIDELLRTINDDSFNDFVDFNNKFAAKSSSNTSQQQQLTASQLANSNRPKSAIDSTQNSRTQGNLSQQQQGRKASNANTSRIRPTTLALGNASNGQQQQNSRSGTTPSTFDNVFRRMSTNFVQNFSKMSASTLVTLDQTQAQQNDTIGNEQAALRREKSSNVCSNSLYVDNQVPARRHSDNTINVPRIQVALSSPQAHSSRTNLNQRSSVSASKLANKWKLTAKTNQREGNDKLSPSLSGALGYMRRHSSGNTTGNDQSSNGAGHTPSLLLNASPFKTKSSSNLGLDFLLSNRSMKRRCSAASMLGHQTQRKAEDLIDAGMKSVQNMFS